MPFLRELERNETASQKFELGSPILFTYVDNPNPEGGSMNVI